MFNANGIADFKNISDDDKEEVAKLLSLADARYADDAAIGLAFESMPTIGLARHIIDFAIILKCEKSDYINDVVALAIALSREGAYHRKQAIQAFERYFEKEPEEADAKECDDGNGVTITLFSDWYLHSELSRLYEQEYDFNKAIEQLKLCIKYSRGNNPADFTRIGDILIKSDIREAERYYDELVKSEYYELHKYAIDYVQNELKEKIASGYVYRPRKNRKAPTLSEAQTLAISAAKCLI